MSRPPKKRCAVYGQNIVPDPLVDPGNPPHRHQACTAAHPTRAHHRMVTLAKSSPSRGAPLPSQKESATVMLGRGLINGKSNGDVGAARDVRYGAQNGHRPDSAECRLMTRSSAVAHILLASLTFKLGTAS